MVNDPTLVRKQKAFFETGATKSLSFRLDALRKLRNAIRANENELMHALRRDLNKSDFEAYSSEIGVVLAEIAFAQRHLRRWVKPQKVKTPLTHFGARSYVLSEPFGVSLIISPWNYPFQLAVAPLVGAIAAGNCAIIKPSELTPATSEWLGKVLAEVFPEEYVSVVQGGVPVSQALLMEPFDYIFFTGSVPVGRVIMEAAAKQLIPLTLELGGKSPCIVHSDANLKMAAKRIAWGKFMNAGQTCIAPDYLYVQSDVKTQFLGYLKDAVHQLYPEPLKSPDFTRIVDESHFRRLCSFLDDGNVVIGGKSNRERLLIEPTVLEDITWADSVMQDEIFGPILPVLNYEDLSEVVEGISHHPKPLSLYIFSESKAVQQRILSGVSFGGGCVNDTVYHFASPNLPFGGIGNSGMGTYHGKGSFDTFTHRKSVLKQTTLFDISFRYPNVKNGLNKIKLFLK